MSAKGLLCATCSLPVEEPGIFLTEYEGEHYEFCTEQCKDEFLLDPERYLHDEEDLDA